MTPIPESKRARCGGIRCTDEVLAAWRTTLHAARTLKAAAIAFQCPPSFAPSAAYVRNLREFFRAIRADAAALMLCWESRSAWSRPRELELAAELGLVLAVDALFHGGPPAAPRRYFRLHGIGGYRYTYSVADLRRLLETCGGETCCLFNNVSMADDAKRFQALLSREKE